MKMSKLLFLYFLINNSMSAVCERHSSEPYISGDSFRSHCQFVLDKNSDFNPCSVKTGDAIFVQLNYLDRFFTDYHPRITARYILVSHNHDVSAPREFKSFLADDKLYAWFTQNMDCVHPKLYPIPIGLINMFHGFSRSRYQTLENALHTLPVEKAVLCYANFNINNNKSERGYVFDLLRDQKWICWENNMGYPWFLKRFAESKFVLSPHGGGLDCYRTWEALLMGSYPIVKTSTLDQLYDGLPVLIVNKWEDVTPEFLEQSYLEMRKKSYKWDRLYFQYWLDLIKKKQDECRG